MVINSAIPLVWQPSVFCLCSPPPCSLSETAGRVQPAALKQGLFGLGGLHPSRRPRPARPVEKRGMVGGREGRG